VEYILNAKLDTKEGCAMNVITMHLMVKSMEDQEPLPARFVHKFPFK